MKTMYARMSLTGLEDIYKNKGRQQYKFLLLYVSSHGEMDKQGNST